MLDIRFIRENSELVKQKLKDRGSDIDLSIFLSVDEKRRDVLGRIEALRAERNRASEEIARRKKEKKEADPSVFASMKELSSQVKALDEELKNVEQETNDLLLAIDNGTQSLKALVFDLEGQLLAREQVKFTPYYSEHPGWAEQDPEVFWQALCQACQGIWSHHRIDKSRIAGVALTTQRDGSDTS